MVESKMIHMFHRGILNIWCIFLVHPRISAQIMTLWNTNPRFGDTIGPIAVFASDEDVMRRGMLHKRAAAMPSEDGCNRNGLALIDEATSVHGAMQRFDRKHNL